jgi:hypothetical protein
MDKKVIAMGLIGLIGLGTGGMVGSALFPREVVKVETNTVTEYIEVPVEVVKEVFVDKVVVDKEVVEVDNGNLQLVLDSIYDNNGNVEFMIDDLDEDEMGMLVDRMIFVENVKDLAVKEVRENALDELDKEYVNGTRLDDRDIEKLKVYSDAEDVSVEDIDFEDFDADVRVKVRFRQDDVYYNAWFVVEIKDGEVEDLELDTIEIDN